VVLPRIIGMVHLGPLPGSPAFGGDLETVIGAAVADAETIAAAGFGGIMVENFGDAPFFSDDVPKVTVAAMSRAVAAVAQGSGLPTGVNVLRNDGLAALAVAAASGAAFIRINVLSGTMYTDQGPIVGRAAEVARARAALTPDTRVMADVFVKHAIPPAGLDLEHAAKDLDERGGADAIVVSGSGTGAATDLDDVRTVRAAVAAPVYVGSGVTSATVSQLLEVASGVIVGTDLKIDGVATNPVDPRRAADLIANAS
jgi:membrane complex biogenesis BtpA family protein